MARYTKLNDVGNWTYSWLLWLLPQQCPPPLEHSMSKIFFNLPLSPNPWESCDFQPKLLLQTVSKLPRHHQSYVSRSARSTCTLTFKSVRGWHLTGNWDHGYLRVCKHNFVPANVIMSVFYRKYIPTRWYSAAKENHCPKLFIHFIQVLWHLRVSILPAT